MTKSIMITGASAGIGRTTAEYFLDAGWNVGLMARSKGPLDEIAKGYENALVLASDVTEPASVEKSFDRFVEHFGRIDTLFNNAGIFAAGGTIDELPLENWINSVNVNLNGAFLCARKAFALMRAQEPQGGRIINNGSIAAHTPRPNSVHYTATKHAITGLTKSISVDGRAFNIACGQIDIGNAATEMVVGINKRNAALDPNATPEYTMDVEHVAQSVMHMADLPLESNVLFMTVMATKMPHIGRG